jgi:hypothetical protein
MLSLGSSEDGRHGQIRLPVGFGWASPFETAPSKGSHTRSTAYGNPYKFGGATRQCREPRLDMYRSW